MSSPDRGAPTCDDVQMALQALLDRERSTCATTAVWQHVEACDRCARALAHDRALSRALERLQGAARAPASLRERLRRLVSAADGKRNSDGSRGGGRGDGSRSS